ncbi:hypothetical protein DM01DRAFT_1298667 [Hesseltinella vesiculosa]|uniref:Metal homeostatis protein bsd2 n=1 Tax=Hesseltinella vesiculosa TaxID=101127 RepID=A0A1X2GVP2_9FUNG|nr:hypothetical protein DM01DRAFT_1298667 [Hesseltinella vesiculosa]
MTQYHQVPTSEIHDEQQRTDLELTFDESLDDTITIPDSTISQHTPIPTVASSSSHASDLPVMPSHDGVFANMSAKPESDQAKQQEAPPSYHTAVQDATPPYWQTTILAPALAEGYVLVDGLPVGSLFVFFWNLLISASLQFLGFILTYLFHSTHAARNGSRAGLGISFVQFGFYLKSKTNWDQFEDLGDDEEDRMANVAIISYFFMILGWFIIVRSVADYLRAKQMEKVITTDPIIAMV